MLSVDRNLCKQGRVKCPLFDACAYQRQKRIEANIRFAAHEMIVHEMPEAFGNVGWIIIDESPLDAVTFGLDTNDQQTLALDRLLDPPINDEMDELTEPRRDLYLMLDKLKLNKHGIAPVPMQAMGNFKSTSKQTNNKFIFNLAKHHPHRLANLEWRAKVQPKIQPSMTAKQVRQELSKAAGNREIALRAMIWQLIDENEAEVCGRIQVRRALHSHCRPAADRRRLVERTDLDLRRHRRRRPAARDLATD